MKKTLFHVVHSNSIDEIAKHRKLEYPFTEQELKLLQRENHFPQEYYLVEEGEKYAFFVMYQMRMNLFTFGKWNLMIKMNVIGYPCSLSEPGYSANDTELFLEYASTVRGPLLVLNVPREELKTDTKELTIGQTLPTCIFTNTFTSGEDYVKSLRSSYRRRLRMALKTCEGFLITEVKNNEIDVYPLYLATYEKSDYKLEKLERGFFEEVEGVKLAFLKDGVTRGFILLRKVNEHLIFMLCGMDYRYETADLYYFMLYQIILYAIEQGCKTIDFGQTSEQTKMKMGANLQERYFYAHHSNRLVNYIVKKGKRLIEYSYEFPDYHVFKE